MFCRDNELFINQWNVMSRCLKNEKFNYSELFIEFYLYPDLKSPFANDNYLMI